MHEGRFSDSFLNEKKYLIALFGWLPPDGACVVFITNLFEMAQEIGLASFTSLAHTLISINSKSYVRSK